MARQLSLPALRALFAQETGEVFLMCLTLTHSSFPAPIRVVFNNEPITRYAGVFEPAAFEVTLPEDEQDKLPQIQLSIENVDRSISEAVRTIVGRVNVTMELVLASSPNVLEVGPFTFQLMSCTYDAMKLTGVLGLEDDLLNTSFPSLTYTPNNSPGLFR
jgi:hypothetical protein